MALILYNGVNINSEEHVVLPFFLELNKLDLIIELGRKHKLIN